MHISNKAQVAVTASRSSRNLFNTATSSKSSAYTCPRYGLELKHATTKTLGSTRCCPIDPGHTGALCRSKLILLRLNNPTSVVGIGRQPSNVNVSHGAFRGFRNRLYGPTEGGLPQPFSCCSTFGAGLVFVAHDPDIQVDDLVAVRGAAVNCCICGLSCSLSNTCPPSLTWTCSTRTYCCPPWRRRRRSST